MKATTDKKKPRSTTKRAVAADKPKEGGVSIAKKTPKTGVVTKPDGSQYLEAEMEGTDFEDRADKLATLVARHAEIGERIAKVKADKAAQVRDAKAELALVEESMGFLGYEVKHRVKKVLRQQTLPKVDLTAPTPERPMGHKL